MKLVEAVTAPDVAVMVAVPAATPVAVPETFTVATPVLEEVQLESAVIFSVVESLKTPVAVNCWLLPAVTE